MGFDIPEPFAWDESFRVDYDPLDKQHKCIFTAIFDCSKAPEDAAKLTNLVEVLKTHFTEEEGMMTKASYGEFDDHKKMHDEFTAKIGEMSVPLKDDGITFAKDWLVTHIKGTDHKYKGKL